MRWAPIETKADIVIAKPGRYLITVGIGHPEVQHIILLSRLHLVPSISIAHIHTYQVVDQQLRSIVGKGIVDIKILSHCPIIIAVGLVFPRKWYCDQVLVKSSRTQLQFQSIKL